MYIRVPSSSQANRNSYGKNGVKSFQRYLNKGTAVTLKATLTLN